MDYFTILNKRKEELDGKELVSLLEHLRKLNGICDSISFTRGIDTKFTLLSVSGNIAYTNLNASDDHFKNISRNMIRILSGILTAYFNLLE